MAAEQSRTMVLKVDLQCRKCYKKVKKVLCKFPQIRDQAYDEKQNTVTIKVVCCCSPEKLKQKIQCKGGESIKSPDIKPYNNPPGDKPNGTKPPINKPGATTPAPPQLPLKPPIVAPGYLPVYQIPIPFGVCCGECCGRRGGGLCYCGYYGRLVYESWGVGCSTSRCDYFTEENPSSCTIM